MKHENKPDALTRAIAMFVQPDGTRVAHYRDGRVITQPTNSDVCEIIQTSSGQKTIRYWNGTIATHFTSGTTVTTKLDGTEIIDFANGDRATRNRDGSTVYEYPGGASVTTQEETPGVKRSS